MGTVLTDKRAPHSAPPNQASPLNEKRPRKAEPSSPFWSPVERGGAGNEIRTHDFNLGKVALYR